MRKLTLYIVLLIVCSSCSNDSEKNIARIDGKYEVLNKEILTTFPADMFYVKNHVVWFGPFDSDYCLHVMDPKTGKEVGVMGKHGQGPDEFVSPTAMDVPWNDMIFVADANGKTMGNLSVDSLLARKRPLVRLELGDREIRNQGYFLRLDDSLFIGVNRNGEPKPFRLYSNGKTSEFGNYQLKGIPIQFGSNFRYNPEKKVLATICSGPMKYLATYHLENNLFKLMGEVTSKVEYKKDNGNIFMTKGSDHCIWRICMTKDYIVGIERDQKKDKTDDSKIGRQFGKNPTTLFVYDYNVNLLKIIDYKVPICDITADTKTNVVYAIACTPDFTFVKMEI